MKYEVIQRLKTKSKTIALTDTLDEALNALPKDAHFDGISYIGQFPFYRTSKNKIYVIQGRASIGLICSLRKEDIEKFEKLTAPVNA